MNGMRPYTCNESVFSLPLCSSDERSTSLYISTASTKSSAGGKGNGHHYWHSICPSHMELMRCAIQTSPEHSATFYISSYRDNKTSRYKKCWETQSWDHCFCSVWTDSHGKIRAEGAQVQGVLYLWWCRFQPSHWERTPIVCELLHTPLDISSAGT